MVGSVMAPSRHIGFPDTFRKWFPNRFPDEKFFGSRFPWSWHLGTFSGSRSGTPGTSREPSRRASSSVRPSSSASGSA